MTDSNPDSAREQTFQTLRSEVVRTWGETRAAAIEATLRRTADSVWKLSALQLSEKDTPGFFLHGASDSDGNPIV